MTGADLKAWRVRVCLTQSDLARRLGKSTGTIQKLEGSAEVPQRYALAIDGLSFHIANQLMSGAALTDGAREVLRRLTLVDVASRIADGTPVA